MEKKTYLCYSGGRGIYLEIAEDSDFNMAFFKIYKVNQKNGNLSIICKDFVFIDSDNLVLQILEFCKDKLEQKSFEYVQISQEGFEYLKSDK